MQSSKGLLKTFNLTIVTPKIAFFNLTNPWMFNKWQLFTQSNIEKSLKLEIGYWSKMLLVQERANEDEPFPVYTAKLDIISVLISL